MRQNYWNQEEQWASGGSGGFQQCPLDEKESDIKETGLDVQWVSGT